MKKVENITSVVGTIIEKVLQELPNVTTEEMNVADLGNRNDGDSLPEVVRMGSEHWSPVNGIADRAREGWDETLRYGVKRVVEVFTGAFDHLGHIHDDEHAELFESSLFDVIFALADDFWDFEQCPSDFRLTFLKSLVDGMSEKLWGQHWSGRDDALVLVNRTKYRKMKKDLREWDHLDESYDGADNVAWEIEHLREEAKKLREELAQKKSSKSLEQKLKEIFEDLSKDRDCLDDTSVHGLTIDIVNQINRIYEVNLLVWDENELGSHQRKPTEMSELELVLQDYRADVAMQREAIRSLEAVNAGLILLNQQLRDGSSPRPQPPERESLSDSEYDALVTGYQEELESWHIDQISKALSAMEDDFVDSEDEWGENLRAAVGHGTYHDARARHDLYFNDRVLQETNNYVNSLERYVETIVDCIANASVNVSSAQELIGDADRKIRQWAAREDLESVGGE